MAERRTKLVATKPIPQGAKNRLAVRRTVQKSSKRFKKIQMGKTANSGQRRPIRVKIVRNRPKCKPNTGAPFTPARFIGDEASREMQILKLVLIGDGYNDDDDIRTVSSTMRSLENLIIHNINNQVAADLARLADVPMGDSQDNYVSAYMGYRAIWYQAWAASTCRIVASKQNPTGATLLHRGTEAFDERIGQRRIARSRSRE